MNPDRIEELLRTRLRPTRVPAADLAWQRLQPALRAPAARSRMPGRALRVGLGVLVAILATLSIALASSPDLRQQLAGLVGVGMTSQGNRVSALQPPPPFTVFQPTKLPAGTRLAAQAYNPGPSDNGQSSWSEIGSSGARPAIVGASAQRVGSPEPSQQGEVAAQRRAQELLGATKEATLVLVYATPKDQLVAVVERSARGKALPPGDPVSIGQTKGTIAVSGGETLVSWIERDTFLQFHATTDRAAAVAFADHLTPTALTNPAKPQAAAARAAALRAIPTPVPLAQRVAAVETPAFDPAVVATTCGHWNPDLARTASAARTEQATCVARAIVGFDQPGSYGVSREQWREAAARLGLAPSIGPTNDPTVWFVELSNRTETQAWVVVLDARTGHPDLVVRLKPDHAGQSTTPGQP